MNIRVAKSEDGQGIQRLYLSAFPEGEGEVVSKIAIDLLDEKTTPKILSLVAETEGDLLGHVAFSPVTVDSIENFHSYILAPLAVQPDFQKRHIGSQLIEQGLQQLSLIGVNVVFVYGDPEYYSRFGFSVEAAHQFRPEYKMEYPFGWQAVQLNKANLPSAPVTIKCVAPLSSPSLW
ncbi:MAG: N-acetyltransferase [Amphritea sp.]|nr:N-acetyltransferase [Amphritea sp.]